MQVCEKKEAEAALQEKVQEANAQVQLLQEHKRLQEDTITTCKLV